VNIVVPGATSIVAEALKLARHITANSPDAVQATKRALVLSQQGLGHDEVVSSHVWSRHCERVYHGGNIKEGLKAFVEASPVFFLMTFFGG
jgi:enoyl-CoA hydratase/carnithine racemase